MKFGIIAALVLALAGRARAQEQQEADVPEVQSDPELSDLPEQGGDISTIDLEDLLSAPVVTASGKTESAAEAAANVTVVTREEMLTRGYQSVRDVLAHTLGLHVIDDQVLTNVSVRGVSAGLRAGTRIIRVMVDGVEVDFRPDLTALIGPEFLPLEAIERVEIAKGPLSSLYGANAFLATVNVITREKSLGKQTQVSAGAGVLNGTHPTSTVSGFGHYGDDTWDLLITARAERIDRSGLRVHRTFAAQNPDFPQYAPFFADQSRNDLAKPSTMFARLMVGNDHVGHFKLAYGLQSLDSDAEFQVGSALTHRSQVALHNQWVAANYERGLGRLFTLRASSNYAQGAPTSNDVQFVTANPRYSYTRNFDYQAINSAVSVDLDVGDRLSMRLGGDVAIEDHGFLFYSQTFYAAEGNRNAGDVVGLIGPQDKRRITVTNPGAYLQGSGRPFEGSPLKLFGNVRIDAPQLFHSQVSWRAATVYPFTPTVIGKIIAGRAFQVPSMTMLFGQPGFGTSDNVIGTRTLTNQPRLGPQIVESIEAVASALIFEQLTIDGSIFAQRVSSRLEFTQIGNNFIARNADVQKNAGVELSARWRQKRIDLRLAGSQLITFFNDPVTGASSSTTGAQPLYPAVQGLAGLTLKVPEVHAAIDIEGRFVGARSSSQSNTLLNNNVAYNLPAYALMDITVNFLDLTIVGDRKTRIAVGARNVLNTSYSEPGFGGFDLPQLKRNIYMRITQDL